VTLPARLKFDAQRTHRTAETDVHDFVDGRAGCTNGFRHVLEFR